MLRPLRGEESVPRWLPIDWPGLVAGGSIVLNLTANWVTVHQGMNLSRLAGDSRPGLFQQGRRNRFQERIARANDTHFFSAIAAAPRQVGLW